MKNFVFPGLFALVAAIAHSASLNPEIFAHRNRIDTTVSSPVHQLALPLAVYRESKRDDLGDLRVLNSNGDEVPYTLMRPNAEQAGARKAVSLPMFPITAGPEPAGQMPADVKRNANDQLSRVIRTVDPQQPGVVRGIIIDATSIAASSLNSLTLKMGPTNVPFHPLTIESSNDLIQWRLLRNNAQLVHFEYDGKRNDNETVEWTGGAGKYLRIIWSNPQQAPAILDASTTVSSIANAATTMQWSDPVVATKDPQDNFDYALPARIPVDRLRLALSQPNTLAPIEIQRYVDGTWKSVSNSIVYRLQSPHGDVTSPDIELNLPPAERLRLKVDGQSSLFGAVPPTIQAGFIPHVLVFADRGDGPFDLAWGAASIANDAVPVDTVIPGYRRDQSITNSVATLRMTSVKPMLPEVEQSTPGKAGLIRLALLAVLLACAGLLVALLKRHEARY